MGPHHIGPVSLATHHPLALRAALPTTLPPTDDDGTAPRNQAAVFKDVLPAWNNLNLRALCLATRSDCVMAHVRAASPGTGVSRENCHPFAAGRLLFCHNGRIDTFAKLRRAVLARLSDEVFAHVRGTTDSECIFGLILTYLSNDEQGSTLSPLHQTKPFGHKRLVAAMQKVLRDIEILLDEHGLNGPEHFTTLNFSLTDGDTLVVCRYCDKSPSVPPPSLYFAFGNAQRLYTELTSEENAACSYPIATSSHSSAGGPSSECGMMSGDTASESESDDGMSNSLASSSGNENQPFYYDELPIDLEQHESRPGRLYADVDLSQSCLIVASNPLTRTHNWHPMPRNSLMWCDKGSLPELRLLRGRSRTASNVFGGV